jgi:RNA polymerase sigma-70 factor, ECF subfamily
VRDALAALPLREREVVLLKFHGQLSNSELARALGIGESNAGTRLHRALTRLREECARLDRREVA